LAALTWSTEFDDPIPGMRTLQDAADDILKLPNTQQNLRHWQIAVEMLIRAAEGSPAWLMLARIAMLKAMNHGRERVFSDRKETHWGKRKLARDR
jgi:hypothetical protein